MLELYYDQGLTMGQIAAKLHLNLSLIHIWLAWAWR